MPKVTGQEPMPRRMCNLPARPPLPSLNVAHHELALGFIGISKAREDVATWAKQIPTEGLAFVAWWTEISKKKSLSQWLRKLENLGATPEQRQGLDLPGVGSLLYRFLDSEGEWTDTQMQDAPVAA